MNIRTKVSVIILKQFFVQNPHYIETLCEDPANVLLWEAIFEYFFKTTPFDTVVDTHPLQRRLGSTDPKWDYLFRELNAGPAQTFMRNVYRRNLHYNHKQLKEAA